MTPRLSRMDSFFAVQNNTRLMGWSNVIRNTMVGLSVALGATRERWTRLHVMADSGDNIKRQKRLILHECSEEFKVSFTLKPLVLRPRAYVSSPGLGAAQRSAGQRSLAGSQIQSALCSTHSLFVYQNSSPIGLVGKTSGNLRMFDSVATICGIF